MPANNGSATPPPRIGKIGPYTVFLTPPSTPNSQSSPETSNKSPSPLQFSPETKPVQLPSPPPVMAPPTQFCKENPSSFGFFWDAVARVQNAHASLDEHVAHWFGLNQSKYQWALDDYYESNVKGNQRGESPGELKQITECVTFCGFGSRDFEKDGCSCVVT